MEGYREKMIEYGRLVTLLGKTFGISLKDIPERHHGPSLWDRVVVPLMKIPIRREDVLNLVIGITVLVVIICGFISLNHQMEIYHEERMAEIREANCAPIEQAGQLPPDIIP